MSSLPGERFRIAGGAGAELNANFGFGFEARSLNALDQSDPIFERERDESRRDLDGVEAEFGAFVNVWIHLAAVVSQNAFHESTGGNLNFESMRERDQFIQDISGIETKRTTGEFKRINVGSRDVEQVFKISVANWRVVRASNFSEAHASGLFVAVVELEEIKGTSFVWRVNFTFAPNQRSG